ncbi:MAG: SLC13 family permease [Planctomycetota bacterium]
MRHLSQRMLVGGPILAALIVLVANACGLSNSASCCAFVALVCAFWWIFECLDIAIVGLVPFVGLPLFGVVDHKDVAQSYGHTMILLLLGGFLLSAAMQRSGAHRRIAIWMVRMVNLGTDTSQGGSGRRLVLGFMLATACLSMWISNAATTLMMLPIAVAVLQQAHHPKLRTPMLLGIAYSASIGGMATPIGTPPNVIFMGQMEDRFGSAIPFASWMAIGLPITVILLPIIWWWITRPIGPIDPVKMPTIGDVTSSERRILAVFVVTAGLWIFRTSPVGGWSALLGPSGSGVGDATVALAACLFLFLCPSGEPKSKDSAACDANGTPSSPTLGQDRLLDWPTAAKIPWGILIMFGGGLALAKGFDQSGLSAAIGSQLTFLTSAPTWTIVLSVCLLVTFLTEITSSTATATLLLPILAELSDQANVNPELLMIPGTISCSCAFMLPVATAPNVIVFGAGGIRTDEMARAGLLINFIAAAVITGITMLRFG